MNSADCVVMLSHCGLRTCRKELFGSYCWSLGASKHKMWFPIAMLDERGGHGGAGGVKVRADTTSFNNMPCKCPGNAGSKCISGIGLPRQRSFNE